MNFCVFCLLLLSRNFAIMYLQGKEREVNNMEYQVTLFCTSGKYKPVSTIIKMDKDLDFSSPEVKKMILNRGTQKICATRRWSSVDLKKNGYLKGKIRVYDKAKIEAENKARYEKIKEEKYASGEWKRPTKREE